MRPGLFHVKASGRISVSTIASRFGLGADASDRLTALADLIAGDPAAPTTVTDPADILRDHVADSLVGLELACVRGAVTVADLGAGAGFPGLPLGVALPQSTVALVESNARKCAFIAHAAEVCRIANVEVVNARAEEWAAGMRACDLVTARALAPLAVVAEYAAPLLRIGGTLVAWRGRRDPEDEASGARAADELGLEPAPPVRVEPYPGAQHRHLHPMVKIGETPPRFPRRPGMARKRPLGA